MFANIPIRAWRVKVLHSIYTGMEDQSEKLAVGIFRLNTMDFCCGAEFFTGRSEMA
jgi:hypothetical protein